MKQGDKEKNKAGPVSLFLFLLLLEKKETFVSFFPRLNQSQCNLILLNKSEKKTIERRFSENDAREQNGYSSASPPPLLYDLQPTELVPRQVHGFVIQSFARTSRKWPGRKSKLQNTRTKRVEKSGPWGVSSSCASIQRR